MKAFVRWLPRDARVHQARDPENAAWGIKEHLLAVIADALNLLVWMKTKDAQRRPPRNRPEPIKRPGSKAKRTSTPGGKQAVVMNLADFVRRSREKPKGANRVALNSSSKSN